MALETAALVALAAAGGNFHVPVVAGDAPAGLSGDGRTAVLEEQPASGRSRFAVVDVEQRRLERVVAFIHALETQQGFTVCIDLDALKGRQDLASLKLTPAEADRRRTNPKTTSPTPNPKPRGLSPISKWLRSGGRGLVAGGLRVDVARQPRNEIEAGIHHVWARGVERRLIFGDDDDRRLYLRLLRGVVRKLRWRVLAYCLMPNHVHLCVETPVPNLGRGMHRIHGQYAQEFNRRYARVGHLFQSRFGSRIVHDELALARVVAYIAANPVAADLCHAPEEWDWSSHRAILDGGIDPLLDLARLRAHLAPLGDLRRTHAALVEARLVSDGRRGPA